MNTPIRCAIYTRKSHDERADAQLGSTERQRELCEAYIASQAGASWIALPDHFNDPGSSGGSTNRPALQRLLTMADEGQVDIIVIYKLDRLSRSMADYMALLERFKRTNTQFVSITEHFSTTSSLGRMTLNILLTFAQFERELTSDRARDWKAGARARGLWTSGPPPFGYQLNRLRLEVHSDRAKVVRHIYSLFIKHRSFEEVARRLNKAGVVNRKGLPFEGRLIKATVSRRIYRGELPHDGNYLPGTHAPIVTERQWKRAQAVLREKGSKPHRW